MKRNVIMGAVIALAMLVPSAASASSIVANCQPFGSVPGETFGGSGIPNSDVCGAAVGDTVIYVSATQRFANAPLTNDGAGNFTAQAGGDVLDGRADLFKWNVDFALYNNSNTALNAVLFADTSNGSGTDDLQMAFFHALLQPGQFIKGSENLASLFWQTGVPGLIVGSGIAPNVNANGEFAFSGQFWDTNGNLINQASEVVTTVGGREVSPTPVPEPASMFLLGSGVVGMVLRTRRLRNRKRQ